MMKKLCFYVYYIIVVHGSYYVWLLIFDIIALKIHSGHALLLPDSANIFVAPQVLHVLNEWKMLDIGPMTSKKGTRHSAEHGTYH